MFSQNCALRINRYPLFESLPYADDDIGFRTQSRLDGKELRLLLIEDEASDVALAKELLSESMPDYEWEICATPSMADALIALNESRFDLALVDLTLADMEGSQTVDVLCMAAPYLPLVVYSGTGDTRLLTEALIFGAQSYLQKGHINPDIMRTTLQNALARFPRICPQHGA